MDLLAILAVAFIAGLLLRRRPVWIAHLSRLTAPIVTILLFVVGLTLGLDDHTMANLGRIGLLGLTFAAATTLLSLLAVALVLPIAGRRRARSQGSGT